MILFKKIFKYALIVLAIGYVVLLIGRWTYLQNEEKTAEQVSKIHSTRLQLSDVMGENLPADPGEAADDTVVGVDANSNGIRDDVELAIFEKYPDSAKTRAVLLQYALALQMEFTQPFVSEGVATAVMMEESRSGGCLADTLVPRGVPDDGRTMEEVEKVFEYYDFVEKLQVNNEARIKAREAFYKYIRSYDDPGEECDIDISALAS